MLKVLAELEKLAEQLDSKNQYKFADEVEGIMGEIVSKASVIKKAQERLSGAQIPETIPALQEPGDPYQYGYISKLDSFVVTSPNGRGTIISKDGPYAKSWNKLKARLPSASGPIRIELILRADKAKRDLYSYLAQLGIS